MNKPPLVSVVIIFLNTGQFLQEAIESVIAQTYEHWELLLVDDGSSDGSSEIAKQYVSQNPSRMSYFEHAGHQNLGMSVARNLGIQHAKGSYIAFLDADDYWLSNKLENHVRILDSHPEVGMLFGSMKYWFSWANRTEKNQQDYVPKFSIRAQTLFNPALLLSYFLEGNVAVPGPSAILVRREIAQRIGGFEAAFRGMYEDQAFYAKICLSTSVLATGDCLVYYRQHSNSCCSTAIRSGQTNALRYRFLKWLETYGHENNVKDNKVWKAVRRQLWLYDNSSHYMLPGSLQNNIRWVKKWILRVEEWLLPSSLRDWLWIRN